MKARISSVTVVLAACLGMCATQAHAQDNWWTGGVGGDWTSGQWTAGTPSALFDARAVIGSTQDETASSDAEVDVTTTITSPDILLGDGSSNSGVLNVSVGASLTVVPGADIAENPYGNVEVGLFGGMGSLNVEGTLVADSLNSGTTGAAGTTTTLSGNANVTIGEGFLDRNLRIEGSNVIFNTEVRSLSGGGSTSGNLILGFAGTHTWEIPSSGPTTISVENNVDLGGTLRVEFPDGVPGPNDTFALIDAGTVDANEAIATSFNSVQSSVDFDLEVGEVFAVRNTGGGVNGTIVELYREQRPVLVVNRQSGAVSIDNQGTRESIAIDVYDILSPTLGALDDGAWNSLAPSDGWQEANQSPNHVSELNPLSSASFAASSSTPLGNLFNPPTPTTFGEETEDITFRYAKPGGGYIEGEVIYTGLANETLTLNIDPDTGEAQIVNGTTFTVAIDNYNISSEFGSLHTDNVNWTSLADSGTGSFGDWFEANVSPNQIAELLSDGGLTLAPNAAIDLGTPFNDGSGIPDLQFTFAIVDAGTLDGDFNNDGSVDAADYAVWRNGFGTIYGIEHYNLWRSNYGMSGGTSVGTDALFTGKVLYSPLVTPGPSAATPAPEPCGLALLALASVGLVRRRAA